MTIWKFPLNPFWKRRGVRGIHPPITLNLKIALELRIINPISPLRSLYDHPFYMLPAYNLHHQINNSGPFNYFVQDGYLKILIWFVWGNGGYGRRGSCPPNLSNMAYCYTSKTVPSRKSIKSCCVHWRTVLLWATKVVPRSVTFRSNAGVILALTLVLKK